MARTPEEIAAYHRQWCKDNPAKVKAYSRKWRETHPEQKRESVLRDRKVHAERCKATAQEYRDSHREQTRAQDRKWTEAHREQRQISELKRNYGLTTEEAEQILVKRRAGVCEICGENRSKRALGVDHDHTTGEVRGVLCGKCNLALGYMEDNPAWLRKLADYVEKGQTDE